VPTRCIDDIEGVARRREGEIRGPEQGKRDVTEVRGTVGGSFGLD
jgi:hypothetical protein